MHIRKRKAMIVHTCLLWRQWLQNHW